MMRIDLPLCSIKFCKYFFDGNCGATEGQRGRCEFLEALRAQQSGGWISVEEQLPTSKDAIKTGDIMACDGWGDYYFIHWHDFRVRVNEFTHWQPLPPEPKEAEHDKQ